MKKTVFAAVLFVILSLTVSGILIAKANGDVKVLRINRNSLTSVFDFFSSKKRVIADFVSDRDIENLKQLGCQVKHRLKLSTSFECPTNIIPKTDVRDARVFHVVDLEADQQIQADLVWNEGVDGAGVKVVILDTGIDDGHIELADSVLGQKDFVNNDDIAEDDHGHGTHVAGIITANGVHQVDSNYATGVAPSAGVYMLKVCGASGSCYEDDMMAAMEYAVNSLDAGVMSISIGGGNFGSHCDGDPLAAKVNWVVDNGITVVVAAGNDGSGVSSPACASEAIAVGAVDKSGIVPYWSNRGTALDIVAPGVDILSTYSCLAAGDCSSYWYAWMDGTSMSTPHVAGVVALLLQANPGLTDNEIKSALFSTATPVNKCYKCERWSWWSGRCIQQVETTCSSEITGAGIVNAYQAFLAVESSEPDTDGDGIIDSEDACPEVYGTYCNGCQGINCTGCQVMFCPESGAPSCVDDDSFCVAPNAFGTCSSGVCYYECVYGYDNCNSEWGDGCEANLLEDSDNCGSCSNVCGSITCPDSGCGVGGCGEDEYGYYPSEGQTSCVNGSCSGECAVTCSYDAACDSDDDDDGVLDVDDACPNTYGTDCNGCPDPCSGCAVMSCDVGAPTCVAGTCPDTACPNDGCGVGSCAENEYGTYTPASNTCEIINNSGNCTSNPCTLSCAYSPSCETTGVQCWSAGYEYLYRNRKQVKKFCKCAEGNYDYLSYSYSWGRKTVYQYSNSNDNENWDVTSRASYLPVYRVQCADSNWYYTSQDYYYN